MNNSRNMSAYYAATLGVIVAVSVLLKKKEKRPWVEQLFANRDRESIHKYFKDRKYMNSQNFRKYMRLDPAIFQLILSRVSPIISKQNTCMRNAISAEDRLMVTLRFLATGESFASLQFSTRIPKNTISKIIPETCEAIYISMKDEFLKVPSTEKEWEKVSKEFEDKWNVYNCIGAMDGKHVRITCPNNSGSHYFNYKLYNSIILFALVDANYKFIYVDAGTNGRIGDAGVYAKSSLRDALNDRSILNIPNRKFLGNTSLSTPYVVLADDAFPLSHNIMKPYPLRNITREEKIFNYRLSRGRRMVESCFGILANRFRVFHTPIHLSPEKVTKIILAACTLHNIILEKQNIDQVQNANFFVGMPSTQSRQQFEYNNSQGDIESCQTGREVRERLKLFYNGPGKVSWQDKCIT